MKYILLLLLTSCLYVGPKKEEETKPEMIKITITDPMVFIINKETNTIDSIYIKRGGQ